MKKTLIILFTFHFSLFTFAQNADDLYRMEIELNPQSFGWLTRHPERRITGHIAANGDILLGDNGLIRIPVNNDPIFYIR